jgi:hypothetical protein
MKANWDLWLTVLLIFTCILTPYRIAFEGKNPLRSKIVNNVTDAFFLLDMIFSFTTAYTDEDFRVVDNRGTIAKGYLKSWFLIDLLAILPFEVILGGGGGSGMNDVVRLARIGRLYKLIKLTKLMRVFKIVKDRSKFLKYVQDML